MKIPAPAAIAPGSNAGHQTLVLPILSIVIPCFNEEDVLPETLRRVELALTNLVSDGLVAPSSHAYLVDDGSGDATWSLIEQAQLRSSFFGGIRLSRNRGHQSALIAGLLTTRGDVVISMDADLQDDLGALAPMLRDAADGNDIVYGVRSQRATDTAVKRHTAQFYYRLLRWLGVEIVHNHGDFRLLSRRAVEALRDYGETNLFLRALIPQLGFKSRIVYYERAERVAGTSKYPLGKMVALAADGVTSFSSHPLRLITILGGLTSVLALCLTIWAAAATFVWKAVIPGWASVVIPIYLVSGVQLLCLGVIGEYVGKIFQETKRRPRFHLEQVLEPTPPEARDCSVSAGPSS